MTRQSVLNAALMTFAEKGWAGTTLDEVARRSGVTRGAVYHHTRSKADLLVTVLAEHWPRVMTSAWARLDDPGSDAVERITGFLAEFLSALRDDGRFRALAIVTVDVAPHLPIPDGTTEKRDVMATWREALRGVISEVDPERLPSGLTPDEAVDGLMTTVYGATSLCSVITSPQAEPSPALAGPIVHGLIDGTDPRR